MPLAGKVTVAASIDYTSLPNLAVGIFPLSLIRSIALTSGVGANQADRLFCGTRTITASATDSLDLSGTLTDPFGVTFTLARLKAIMVLAASGNTNSVVVTRPATNGVPLFSAAGDALPVRPGGFFAWCAPDATGVVITPGTGDLIDLVNSGGGSSAACDIAIIGTTA